MKYYKGNTHKDYEREYSERWGWLIGRFMKGERKTTKVAVKFWKFEKGKNTNHEFKFQKIATECTFILKGKIRAQIGSKKMILKAGDYVVIPPRIKSNLAIRALENTEGITIKAPSCSKEETVKLTHK